LRNKETHLPSPISLPSLRCRNDVGSTVTRKGLESNRNDVGQAFFTELAESNANFPRNDRAGIEYTVVDITEILRLMRHTDSGE
jgi:hypothetical protein